MILERCGRLLRGRLGVCGPRYDASVKIKKLHDDHGLPGTRTPADPRFGTGLGQKKGGPLTATRLDNRPHRPTATLPPAWWPLRPDSLLTHIQPGWTPWQVMPGLLLAGVGIGLASTPITTAATPNRQAGMATAAHTIFRTVGLSFWRRRHGAQSSPHSGLATSPKPTLTRRGSPPASAPASQSTPASPWPRQPSRSSSAPTPARPGTDPDNDHLH